MKSLLLWLLIVTLLPAGQALAGVTGSEQLQLLDSAQFSALLDSTAARGILIDARFPDRYREGHIRGAVNVPAPNLEKMPSLPGQDLAAPILVYCDGVMCDRKTGLTPKGVPCMSKEAILPTKSGKAAMAVVRMGYRNVSVLMDGFRGWDLKGFEGFEGKGDTTRLITVKLDKDALKALAAKPDGALFIDLREPADFNRGHAPGAQNIPIASFGTAAAKLDKNRQIVLFCDWGDRSHSAYLKLRDQGFKRIARAVVADWEEAGLAMER